MTTTIPTHSRIEPGILYFGTPVVLISTLNEDGSPNLAPMSSAFWLGWRAMLGLNARSTTTLNMLRAGECVLNLPSDSLAPAVDRLALTTGSDPVPRRKLDRGYEFVPDKFGRAGLTPAPAETVLAPRVAECPVTMEAVVEGVHPVADDDEAQRGNIVAIEVRIQRVHVHDNIRMEGTDDHIDPDAWRPLIMSFQKFYGLGPQVHPSTLARIPERMYRGPDIERARQAPGLPSAASGRSPGMTGSFPITEHVAEMRAAMAAQGSGPAGEAFARDRAELAAGGVPAGVVPPGTVLPGAELLDVHGAATTLEAVTGGGTSVLVFYRGSWCPYCNIALSVYQAELLPRLAGRGIALVAISPEKPDGSLTMREKNSLTFTVVSDPGNGIAGRLGILMRPSGEAVRAAELQIGVDLTSLNADRTRNLPMPATVILDRNRTVRWIDVHPDYSIRTEPRQVIAALDHLVAEEKK